MKLRPSSLLLALTFLLSLPQSPIAQAGDPRLIDVAAVTWSGADEVETKYTEVMQSIDSKVGPQWLSFTSLPGDNRDKKVLFSLGRGLPQPIAISTPMPCSGFQSTDFMGDVRDEAYRRMGISDFSDRYLVIVAPRAGCIWQGKALLGKTGAKGGVLVLHNTASSFVIVHELGHSLGLGHSNLLRCESGARDGAWSRDCRAIEYGGAIDVMGNVETTSPLSVYHQWRLGLLERNEIRESWKSETIELRPSSSFGGTRAIFLKDGSATYWLEYRKARPGDFYKSGLVIYRSDPPSVAAIVSPNPEDQLGAEPVSSVTLDIWMLNLDDYRFSSGRASGSMTLQSSSSVQLASGNVNIFIKSATEDAITVEILRRPDTTPPPTPEITPPLGWRTPTSFVVDGKYDDRESTIDYFEIERNGLLSRVNPSSLDEAEPTYLYPLTPKRVLPTRDLPEGDYQLRVRAVDIWGNASLWSNPAKVVIDRGYPTVNSDVRVTSATKDRIEFEWLGASDAGVGLCETNRTTNEGWILTRSGSKERPRLNIPNGRKLDSSFQVVDCRGNGIVGKMSTDSAFTSAKESRRTGKWEEVTSSFGGSMRCIGRCTISGSFKGNLSVLAGIGNAELFVSGKKIANLTQTDPAESRVAENINLGSRNQVVRVQGRNFVIHGFLKFDLKLSEEKKVNLIDRPIDDSLNDATQRELQLFGFKGDDFDSTWNVLPMPRGTTLLDPTLDLCESEYQSEIDRISRRQVTANKVGSRFNFLSSETVKYASPAVATRALTELQSNLKKCIIDGGGLNRVGAKTQYRFQNESIPRISGMTEESRAVYIHALIGSGSQTRALLGYYQFNQDIFSGLYVVANQGKFFTASEVLHWTQVAAELGKRLELRPSPKS